jgi:CRISPR-associated protein Cas5d
MSVRLEVWGDGALFSRPEMSVERVSYDVMTPSAARGILDSIYWHPGMFWRIDRIYILNPISWDNIRRNEVSAVIGRNTARSMMSGKGGNVIYSSDVIQQRASTYLRDVHYVIDAHFVLKQPGNADLAAKAISIFNRRAQKGQCYHHPYFGCREFPVDFRLWNSSDDPKGFETGVRDLGFILFDMDYSDSADIKPLFFRAKLVDGVMDLRDVEVVS